MISPDAVQAIVGRIDRDLLEAHQSRLLHLQKQLEEAKAEANAADTTAGRASTVTQEALEAKKNARGRVPWGDWINFLKKSPAEEARDEANRVHEVKQEAEQNLRNNAKALRRVASEKQREITEEEQRLPDIIRASLPPSVLAQLSLRDLQDSVSVTCSLSDQVQTAYAEVASAVEAHLEWSRVLLDDIAAMEEDFATLAQNVAPLIEHLGKSLNCDFLNEIAAINGVLEVYQEPFSYDHPELDTSWLQQEIESAVSGCESTRGALAELVQRLEDAGSPLVPLTEEDVLPAAMEAVTKTLE